MEKPKLLNKWDFDSWATRYDKTIAEAEKAEDWMYKKYNFILNKVTKYSRAKPKDKVLEIGIGTGNLASRFLKRGCKVIGIDPSNEMRKVVKEKYPEIEIYEGDFLNIPLKIEVVSVDLIVSSFAYHHLTAKEKEKAIVEMKRILKPNGKIVIADLMFQDKNHEEIIKEKLRSEGRQDIIDEIGEEYYGYFDNLKKKYTQYGFSFQGEQLTDFVWIFCATLKNKIKEL